MPRINFLFVLILLLTACIPNATLAPLPTVTSSPVVSITPTIAATEIPSFANPISPENMDLLTRAGYQWDEQSGELKMANGFVALTLQNGKWLDTRTGIETSLESLKFVEVNTKDWEGREIGSILTRKLDDGGMEFYNWMTDSWQRPLDADASIAAISKNNIPKSLDNWKTHVEIDFNDIVEADIDDHLSGRAWITDLLNLDPIDPNAVIKPLVISQWNLLTGKAVIDQYQIGWVDRRDDHEAGHPPDLGLTSENDSREIVSVYKMKSPINGQWVTRTAVRLQYEGKNVIFSIFSGDELLSQQADGAYQVMEGVWSNPSRFILMPVVGAWKGEKCEPAYGEAQTWNVPSQTVCDLVGYRDSDEPGHWIPDNVISWMYQDVWDTPGLQWRYADGNWVFRLQGTIMPGIVQEHEGIYFTQNQSVQSQWDAPFPDTPTP